MMLSSSLKFLPLISRVSPRVMYRSMSEHTVTSCKDDVVFHESGTVGTVILNRPKAMNALTLDMVKQIYLTLKEWESTKDLVLMTSSSDKTFCAGGDLGLIYQALSKGPTETYTEDLLENMFRINYLLYTYKKPYVAVINGITIGGGAGLSVHGKYSIATDKTRFSMPEVTLGHYPDNGGTYFLPKLRGQLGMYLGLTGRSLKGLDVKLAGLATHYVLSSNVQHMINELMLSGGRNVEKILNNYEDPTTADFTLAPYADKIDSYFSAGSIEEIMARLRDDGGEWAKGVLGDLMKMSPLALKIAHKIINRGRNLTLAECLVMENRLLYSMAYSSDMKNGIYEGIRALIIDKDKKPAWELRTLEEVTDDYLEGLLKTIPVNGDLEFPLER